MIEAARFERSRAKQILERAGRNAGPFLFVAGICFGAMAANGCGDSHPPENEPNPPRHIVRFDRNSLPLQLSDDYAFSVDAIRFYCAQSGNWVFSPLGPQELAAALAVGANGKTREELRAAIHLRDTIPVRTRVANDSLECEVATSMWISSEVTIVSEYVSSVLEKFNAELMRGYGVNMINDWASNRTRGHIFRLVEHLSSMSSMILVSAVYFQGRWVTPFEENATNPLPFHVDARTTIETPTMSRTGEFRYVETETHQMIVMDYVGGDFVYACLLPREGLTPSNLVQDWTEGSLAGLLATAQLKNVQVYLPKYKMRWRDSLIPFLRQQGVSLSFDARADFSGISSEPLFISEFLQESTFDLDEKGTVATSATVVELMRSIGYANDPEQIPVFRADRPFLYFIVAPAARCVLFAGVMANPAAS